MLYSELLLGTTQNTPTCIALAQTHVPFRDLRKQSFDLVARRMEENWIVSAKEKQGYERQLGVWGQ